MSRDFSGRADAIRLGPGEGRRYELGALTALFKADEAETGAGYSISEWRLAPGFAGVGAHRHEANDEVFYGLEGAASLLVGEEWTGLGRDHFVRIPAGVIHDFRNESGAEARLLNVFVPGGFERNMPAIARWFAGNG